MEKKGIIFDIKKFAVHDGPGIRSTVFFKGCPLRCLWCHNPEGISAAAEVMVFTQRCLASCRICVRACPQKALARIGGRIVLKRDRCRACGLCAEACPAEALRLVGKKVGAGSVLTELAKDSPFYRNSNGGVTFSGGEPLQQPEFLHALLLAAKEQGWHTAVDTCGHAPFSAFAKIMPLVDLFLYDLKCIDPLWHRRLTGVSNALILENLSRLSSQRQCPGHPHSAGPGQQRFAQRRTGTEWPLFAAACRGASGAHPPLSPGRQRQMEPARPVPIPFRLSGRRRPRRCEKAMDIFVRHKISVSSGG